VKIGQYGVGTQLTNGFATMAYAMLVGIGLVYPIVVILVRLLLVPLVTVFALPLVVIGGFVALATTGRALDLSALIGLLMLRGIVATNAIALRDLVQHRTETGADVHTVVPRPAAPA
jgi:HAE1 family hydrophobic/amphiphilic exporter-1